MTKHQRTNLITWVLSIAGLLCLLACIILELWYLIIPSGLLIVSATVYYYHKEVISAIKNLQNRDKTT